MDVTYCTPSQVQRCLSLLRLNVGATRRFYQLAAAHLPPGEVVHLILALQSALVQFIKEDQEGTSTATGIVDKSSRDLEGTRSATGTSDITRSVALVQFVKGNSEGTSAATGTVDKWVM